MANPETAERGFLLHVFHRPQGGRSTVCAVGKLESGETFGLMDDRMQPMFFVRETDIEQAGAIARADGMQVEVSDLRTMDGEPVAEVSGPLRSLRRVSDRLAGQGVRTYEADVSYTNHFLMRLGLRGTVTISGEWRPGQGVDRAYVNPDLAPAEWEPHLSVLALDIETDPRATQVLAVSLVGVGLHDGEMTEEVHVWGEAEDSSTGGGAALYSYSSERALLGAVETRVRELDPDILTGWNVIDFDLTVLQKRFKALQMPFNLGRTKDTTYYREGEVWGGSRMVVYGRQVLDALHLVRAVPQRFDDYTLETVAQEILGRGKTLDAAPGESAAHQILDLYRNDRAAFCEYCLEDSRLVMGILEAEQLIELSVRRSTLTGLPLERAWGSIAPFDFLYISELRKRGMVAPSLGVDRLVSGGGAPGGLILAPEPGLYRHVLVFDFKSLYPSIMRTFNIDPLARLLAPRGDDADVITAPNGARFSREPGILPMLLERFFEERAAARRRGDELASLAYKILMNSFYGVLGTDACRFAANELAGAITGFGHMILRWGRDLLESDGARVLYGDTDSLFLDPGLPDDVDEATARETGDRLAQKLNDALAAYVTDTYGADSFLELEFEKYYRRFLMPSQRGAEGRGRAKGYAGLRVVDGAETLDVVGMEAVRRDWTDMAHHLQIDLLALLFRDAGREEVEACIREWIRAVRAGEKDDELVYRKGLRKGVDKYTASSPPHVKAARLLEKPSGVIHYVVTRDGPQPVGHVSAPLDYDHYVDKQVEPIVRTIAQVTEIDIDDAVYGVPKLF